MLVGAKFGGRVGIVLFVLIGTVWQSLHSAVPEVSLRLVASGLSLPLEVVNAGDGSNRIFIVEQAGKIRIVKNGALLATPFLDIGANSPTGLTSTSGERGLLGLAFHPNFASNRAFYIFYTRATDGALIVARYLANAANPDLADASSRIDILETLHPANSNHNGGRLVFGPDGYLYIGTGDGGGTGDPDRNGQRLTNRLGKILRISVDGGGGYQVPLDNPFAGQTCASACPEIWAYGLRNPWKFSFDRVTGDLFIGDVGQGTIEEVDFLPYGTPAGTNFGWGVLEGNNCYNNFYFGTAGGCTALGTNTRPIITYGHDATGGNSITGGYRYRGSRSVELEGYYIYGDYISKRIWAATRRENGTWSTQVLLEPPAVITWLSSFGEDEAGELYLADYGGGKLFAIDGPSFSLTHVAIQGNHGASGGLDINVRRDVPLRGAIDIDPRTISSGRRLVLRFSAVAGAPASAIVRDFSGATIGSSHVSVVGNDVVIDLSAVVQDGRYQVEVNGINGNGGQINVPFGLLAGDINGSGRVSAADIAGIKARLGQFATNGNARFDLDGSGSIDAADLILAKNRSARTID